MYIFNGFEEIASVFDFLNIVDHKEELLGKIEKKMQLHKGDAAKAGTFIKFRCFDEFYRKM